MHTYECVTICEGRCILAVEYLSTDAQVEVQRKILGCVGHV